MSTGDVIPVRSIRENRTVTTAYLKRTEVAPEPVWCPTTFWGTWVMRLDGCITITGNTRAKARALRDAVNVGMAALEELGPDGAPERRDAPPLTNLPPVEGIQVSGKVYTRPQVEAAYKVRRAEAERLGVALPSEVATLVAPEQAPLPILVGATQSLKRLVEATQAGQRWSTVWLTLPPAVEATGRSTGATPGSGWVHRLAGRGRCWLAKAPDGTVLVAGLSRRRDAVAALLEEADRGEVFPGGRWCWRPPRRGSGEGQRRITERVAWADYALAGFRWWRRLRGARVDLLVDRGPGAVLDVVPGAADGAARAGPGAPALRGVRALIRPSFARRMFQSGGRDNAAAADREVVGGR